MLRVEDLDTPAIVIDVDAMERNLQRVAAYTAEHRLRLRPHTKTHKIPELGRRQLQLGAAGLTVAKTSEAEVMLEAEPGDLLLAYPVVGSRKLARLVQVANSTDLTVSLDSTEAANQLSEAANGSRIGVLAEMDAGLGRVGVRPGRDLLDLARTIDRLPNLELRGIAFYPGHIKATGAEAALASLDQLVSEQVKTFEQAGLRCDIVSGGSTPTLFESHKVTGQTEIRPGTYIFNDRNTWAMGACSLEDCAASILTTVVSTAVDGQIIIDGGSKTFSSDRCAVPDQPGFGYFVEDPDLLLDRMNEEHGYVQRGGSTRKWKVGDRTRVIPNHICVAMNLHEQVYGVKGEEVVTCWQVKGRGKLQ